MTQGTSSDSLHCRWMNPGEVAGYGGPQERPVMWTCAPLLLLLHKQVGSLLFFVPLLHTPGYSKCSYFYRHHLTGKVRNGHFHDSIQLLRINC